MTYRLSERQSAWLHAKTTTGEQRAAFLAKGPAEAGSFIDMKDKSNRQFYRPMVRGVIVSEVEYDDAAKAGEEAEAVRAKFAAETDGFPLNEIALGIDDRNRLVWEMCSDANIAVGTILHMGAVLADPEVYGEEMDDLLCDLRDARPDAPIWSGLPTDIMPKDGDTDSDELSTDEAIELLTDRLRCKGLFGFIVTIRTPVPTSFSEHGYGYSWGYSAHTRVYGETFEDAVKQGAEWAEAFRENCRAKAA